jgi:hypothetical protein
VVDIELVLMLVLVEILGLILPLVLVLLLTLMLVFVVDVTVHYKISFYTNITEENQVLCTIYSTFYMVLFTGREEWSTCGTKISGSGFSCLGVRPEVIPEKDGLTNLYRRHLFV